VQVPAGTRPDAGLPVMVRIHGGGFLVTAFGLHDSAYMAREEHMIVVAMNYRLDHGVSRREGARTSFG
jgi:carboxylesterase type B